MKARATIALGWVVGLGSLVGCSERGERSEGSDTSAAASTQAIPDSIRIELERPGLEDQDVRRDLTQERMQDTAFGRAMVRGDSARTIRLRAIVEQYGWPDSTKVGQEAAEAAFLILDEEGLEERRRSMGLPPMDAYMRMMAELYGAPVVRRP